MEFYQNDLNGEKNWGFWLKSRTLKLFNFNWISPEDFGKLKQKKSRKKQSQMSSTYSGKALHGNRTVVHLWVWYHSSTWLAQSSAAPSKIQLIVNQQIEMKSWRNLLHSSTKKSVTTSDQKNLAWCQVQFWPHMNFVSVLISFLRNFDYDFAIHIAKKDILFWKLVVIKLFDWLINRYHFFWFVSTFPFLWSLIL